MESMIKKYQQKFRKVKEEMEQWSEIQAQLISLFNNASSIIERLPIIRKKENFGALNCVDEIADAVLSTQLQSLQSILLSMGTILEEFRAIVLSLEKILQNSGEFIRGRSSQLNAKPMQQRIGLKPSLADCLDGLKLLYDMHFAEFRLKSSIVSALPMIFFKSSISDLGPLRQLLVDQPNIPPDEGYSSSFWLCCAISNQDLFSVRFEFSQSWTSFLRKKSADGKNIYAIAWIYLHTKRKPDLVSDEQGSLLQVTSHHEEKTNSQDATPQRSCGSVGEIEIDPFEGTSWIVVKKQRVTILLPPQSVSEGCLVQDAGPRAALDGAEDGRTLVGNVCPQGVSHSSDMSSREIQDSKKFSELSALRINRAVKSSSPFRKISRQSRAGGPRASKNRVEPLNWKDAPAELTTPIGDSQFQTYAHSTVPPPNKIVASKEFDEYPTLGINTSTKTRSTCTSRNFHRGGIAGAPCVFADEPEPLSRQLTTRNLKRQLEEADGLVGWLLSMGLVHFVKIFEHKPMNEFHLASLTMPGDECCCSRSAEETDARPKLRVASLPGCFEASCVPSLG